MNPIQDPAPPRFTITSILLIEHRLLRELMHAMEQSLLAGMSAAALRERAAMLDVALDTHAIREEEQLFPQLRTRSGRAQHLVEMMELVHGEVRELFEQVQNDTDPRRNLWTILEMTAAHFDREENEVFPLAISLMETEELLRPLMPSSGS